MLCHAMPRCANPLYSTIFDIFFSSKQTPRSYFPTLVLLRRLLTRLQLIQIPPADIHIPLILRHAVGILLDIHRAGPTSRRLAVVGGRAVVEARVHGAAGLCVGIRGLLVLLGSGGRLGGAAAEEAADCVPDGGADGDTAVCGGLSVGDFYL